MNKTAIVIDSSNYCSKEFIKKHNITVVPLSVNFDNVSYSEGVEDIETVVEIFNRIDEVSKLPTTSQPSAIEFISKFEELRDAGYKNIITLTITSNLSGTYQGAVTAANMFLEENPGMDIRVFDSKNVGPGSALSVQEIAMRVERDGDISTEKINDIIDFHAENVRIFVLVDTLDYLSYGGRISPSIAALGNLFGIKPVLRIDAGVFDEHAKTRSKKKAYQEILKQFDLYTQDEDEEYVLLSAHANNEKEAKKILKIIADSKKDVNAEVIDPVILGPVVSIHVGPLALGVGFSKKYRD